MSLVEIRVARSKRRHPKTRLEAKLPDLIRQPLLWPMRNVLNRPNPFSQLLPQAETLLWVLRVFMQLT